MKVLLVLFLIMLSGFVFLISLTLIDLIWNHSKLFDPKQLKHKLGINHKTGKIQLK